MTPGSIYKTPTAIWTVTTADVYNRYNIPEGSIVVYLGQSSNDAALFLYDNKILESIFVIYANDLIALE